MSLLFPSARLTRRTFMKRRLLSTFVATGILLSCGAAMGRPIHKRPHHRPTIRYFIATAYSIEGTGASGKWSHPGTVAADTGVLPLNSRIRILGAGDYSGDYTVEDTGAKVDGHHIDVYMPSRAEAKKFGRQRVKVLILKYGDDTPTPPDPNQRAEAKAENKAVRAAAAASAAKQ
jgi:3D (Asp-Asp-Asp) domain-containing protein